MEKAKVEITIMQTDSGVIRIIFSDGSSYPIKDCMDNIGLLSALEVELKYALKRAEQEKVTDDVLRTELKRFNDWMCGNQFDGRIPLIDQCIHEYMEYRSTHNK